MTGRRRRRAERPTRGAVVTGAVTAGVAGAAALGLLLAGCGGDGQDTGREQAADPSSSAPASASPSPSRSYALSKPPRAVPAVREHTAARGPGWRPAEDSRVLVRDDGLADEGRLLAGELGIDYGGDADARAGDVELDVAGGGPAESYTMTVRDGRVRITGADEAGAFYGTRTVKQSVRAQGRVPEGTVKDRPAKPQRGLMLDNARKPFTARWIEDRLREAADLKLNQFGLHFSDDQAFRIESDDHPEIVSEDALSKDEVRRILRLADSLHITVVPEIDSPGHLGAVIDAYPDLQLRDASGRATRGAIDIGNPASARLIDSLLREYAELFPGRSWHLGGDEYQALVKSDPEASYPRLAALARERYGADATVQDLATAWLNDRQETVEKAGKTTVKVWNDGLHPDGAVRPNRDREVEYWTGKEIGAREPREYLDDDWKVVNLNDEYLYYVLGEPNTFRYPTGRRIYEEWSPLVLRGTQPVPARYDDQILGGVFAIWCDQAEAQTPEQIATAIRLPLAALAQRVWDTERPLTWDQFAARARAVR
ncbi:glycoside hydrolase family 20 protein [Streptomyces sp. NPDC060194]|uniref:beta-N-acetylhexosaminidase n=1 Tax=Streptomyces sp. NPDC060194 TaxID=3347069 RepID=UPI0036676932